MLVSLGASGEEFWTASFYSDFKLTHVYLSSWAPLISETSSKLP